MQVIKNGAQPEFSVGDKIRFKSTGDVEKVITVSHGGRFVNSVNVEDIEKIGVMKIKKIQWGNKFVWNGCERYVKELPFNMTALVREMVPEFYAWSIKQGTKVIASGKADTFDKAKADCENAWESIVMEALEV